MRSLRCFVLPVLLTGVIQLAALAADTDVDWKWDTSGRTDPTPVVTAQVAPLVNTFFQMTTESEQGIIYVGLLMIVR